MNIQLNELFDPSYFESQVLKDEGGKPVKLIKLATHQLQLAVVKGLQYAAGIKDADLIKKISEGVMNFSAHPDGVSCYKRMLFMYLCGDQDWFVKEQQAYRKGIPQASHPFEEFRISDDEFGYIYKHCAFIKDQSVLSEIDFTNHYGILKEGFSFRANYRIVDSFYYLADLHRPMFKHHAEQLKKSLFASAYFISRHDNLAAVYHERSIQLDKASFLSATRFNGFAAQPEHEPTLPDEMQYLLVAMYRQFQASDRNLSKIFKAAYSSNLSHALLSPGLPADVENSAGLKRIISSIRACTSLSDLRKINSCLLDPDEFSLILEDTVDMHGNRQGENDSITLICEIVLQREITTQLDKILLSGEGFDFEEALGEVQYFFSKDLCHANRNLNASESAKRFSLASDTCLLLDVPGVRGLIEQGLTNLSDMPVGVVEFIADSIVSKLPPREIAKILQSENCSHDLAKYTGESLVKRYVHYIDGQYKYCYIPAQIKMELADVFISIEMGYGLSVTELKNSITNQFPKSKYLTSGNSDDWLEGIIKSMVFNNAKPVEPTSSDDALDPPAYEYVSRRL